MMHADEIIKVVQAWKDARVIQERRVRTSDGWVTRETPKWNFFEFEYRVKPQERVIFVPLMSDGRFARDSFLVAGTGDVDAARRDGWELAKFVEVPGC